MLWYAWVFLVVAILAGLLGFGGIAAASAGIAKICFVIFLVLFLVSLIAGRRQSDLAHSVPATISRHATDALGRIIYRRRTCAFLLARFLCSPSSSEKSHWSGGASASARMRSSFAGRRWAGEPLDRRVRSAWRKARRSDCQRPGRQAQCLRSGLRVSRPFLWLPYDRSPSAGCDQADQSRGQRPSSALHVPVPSDAYLFHR